MFLSMQLNSQMFQKKNRERKKTTKRQRNNGDTALPEN